MEAMKNGRKMEGSRACKRDDCFEERKSQEAYLLLVKRASGKRTVNSDDD